MTCTCGSDTAVTETRKRPDGSLRRRRKCLACGVRSTTIEQFITVDEGKATTPKRIGRTHVYLTTKDERKAIRSALKVLTRLVDKTRES